jgi:pyruvate/2-oxoglutarate dehydrogenase complex dihydrolipoamide acyltransferase (E2) component
VRVEELSRAKRVEIKYLASGAAHTLASVVTVPCPAAGLRAALAHLPELGQGGTAVIVYEAARLLKKYPVFNAYYADGRVHYYEQVNVGFAVDGGHGLKVPVIAQADRKGLPEIAREMEDRILDYVNDALPLAALAGGTFTLTDLSAEGVTSFHPLINQGQSAILGIGAAYASGEPGRASFNLILAFDHQLAEGRTAARMLCELRDRLATYEGVGARPRGGPGEI